MFTFRVRWLVFSVLSFIFAFKCFSTLMAEELAPCTAAALGVESFRKDDNTSACASERQNTPKDQAKLCLGDRVVFTVKGLQSVTAACKSKFILFLNGQALNSLSPIFSDQPNEIKFHLVTTSEPGAVWREIFQDPLRNGGEREIRLNIGFPNDPSPMPVAAIIELFPPFWTGLFIIVVAGLVALFGALAAMSGIVRDAPPPANTIAVRGGRPDFTGPPPEVGPFSLARTQGAWWLFLVTTAYALIGIVTGNFTSSLNGTALILLGIGAGTVLAGVVISESKVADQAERADQLKQRLLDLTELDQLRQLVTAPGATPSEDDQARHDELLNKYFGAPTQFSPACLTNAITRTAKDYAIATNQGSQGFLIDILSDADGVSFPRFQLFAWTIVLGLVFAMEVLRDVAMPVFDATLLGLLGVSSGTYLGMKIPEATAPKQGPATGH
jgi:hypothetical protein